MWNYIKGVIGFELSTSAATSTSTTTASTSSQSSSRSLWSHVTSQPHISTGEQPNSPYPMDKDNSKLGDRSVYSTESPTCNISEDHTVTVSNWYKMSNESSEEVGQFEELHFYFEGQPFFEFANTSEFSFHADGVLFLSTEHYFQCWAFGGPTTDLGSRFIGPDPTAGKKPAEAARYARPFNKQKVEGWTAGEGNRRMRMALDYKFSFETSPVYAMHLLKTWEKGHHILVEDSDRDCYWGAFPNEKETKPGENKLGIMLMEYRGKKLKRQWQAMHEDEKTSYRTLYNQSCRELKLTKLSTRTVSHRSQCPRTYPHSKYAPNDWPQSSHQKRQAKEPVLDTISKKRKL